MIFARTLMLIVWFWPLNPAHGWQLQTLGPNLELIGDNGVPLRMAAIEVIQTEIARDQIVEFARRPLIISEPALGFDRWGSMFVQPLDEDGRSLQATLLQKGLALCRPDLAGPCSPSLLAAERRARSAALGIWADSFPIASENAGQVAGEYALVKGRILHSQEARRYVYLNFGETWKTDFTVRIPKRYVKRMAKSGLDLLALTDLVVEVRGFVFEENGPMIELSEAAAVEIVP